MRRQLERGYRGLRSTIPHERWEAAKRRLHPALVRSMRRRLSAVPDLGTISVVVPCYRVEEYLADCLTSVISQTYPHLEIIVVIDGSPDRSAEIARGFARWDRRIRVVEQPNGGLGNARNTGIAHASGDFIVFADSDDTVPLTAYATMVESLARTGSDFAVGNLVRRDGASSWVPRWAQDVHRADRPGVTLDEAPEVLADVFSWNKLFRRDFFTRAVGRFPEGIRYEDQEPTARAYALARSFDILATVVYQWYIRGDGSSITQQKSNIRDLDDRLTVMRAVSGVLTEHASQRVVEHWHAKSVGLDLRAFYAEVPRTGPDFWELLRSGVRDVSRSMSETSWGLVELHDRILARLVERDERDDVCTALRVREEHGDGMVVDPTRPRPTGAPVYLDQLRTRFDPADLVLSPLEDRLTAGLTGYRVDGATIEVSGLAYVDGVDLDEHPSTLSVRLVPEPDADGSAAGGPVHELPVRRTRLRALDDVVNSASVSQAPAGFVATVDVAALVARQPVAGKEPGWHVELTLGVADKAWTGRFRVWERRWTANVLDHGPLVDGHRLLPRFTEDRGLELLLRPAQVAAVSATLDGRRVDLVLPEDGPRVTAVEALCTVLGRTERADVTVLEGEQRASLTIPPLPPGAPPRKEYEWEVRAVTAEGTVALDLAGGTADLPVETARSAGLRVALAPTGELVLVDRRIHAVVREVVLDGWPDTFVVRGLAVLPPGTPFRPALASDTDVWEPTDAVIDPVTGAFEARFAVTSERWGRPGLARTSRGRSLRLLLHPGSTRDSVWLPVAPGALAAVTHGFLQWHRAPSCDLRLTVTSRARALWVTVRPPLGPDEDGRRAQLALQRTVPSLLARPLREAVLLSCFAGRHAADSPLAIHHELRRRGYDGDLVWAVADHACAAPQDARTVVLGTADHLEALHTSRWLVSNANFPPVFRKRPDQTYLQTWHGTPLKRIGNDVPSTSLSLSYRALMEREVRAWDVLLAQNPFAAETLPRAFGYEGRTLELGYPRNDLLAGPPDPERVAAVRAALGVAPHARLALYAPTWRDNRRTTSRGYALVNHLELGQVSKALSDEWTVLVRGHSNTPGLAAAEDHAGVLDVSDYPDIGELMLVADVLVTDYSSVMFDFAVTGRPMLFLVPDLEEYAGTTRGFYLDLAEIAPGPLLASTEGVIAALRGLGTSVTLDLVEREAAFRARFAPLDDGHAAERVVDAVWGR
ncbi:CDP-glycerol glycerophosphotransferase family protein [Oryzobacter sp. R7]|uniref:bifunctional glycosyltransferase/CDP-glycerol:glycerophosphate glycerophosphotransferase n=1 Tax=Oryzobacter faecalis TaxID=3388656 RepID=UPI00398CB33D